MNVNINRKHIHTYIYVRNNPFCSHFMIEKHVILTAYHIESLIFGNYTYENWFVANFLQLPSFHKHMAQW